MGGRLEFAGVLPALFAAILSSTIAARAGNPSSQTLYDRAVVLANQGREAASAELLQPLASAPDGRLSRRARWLLMLDERALFQYRAALAAVKPLLGNPDPQLANRVRLLKALTDIPPESAEHRAPVLLRSSLVTAAIGRKKLHLLIDTGASFSVLSYTVAQEAGLHIRAVHYEIKSALGRRLHADAATGDLAMAGTRVHNVVFLVLPDGTLPPGLPYSGVVGLPVLRALGPLIISPNAGGMTRHRAPLVFVGGNVGVEVAVHGTGMLCALDTGSNRSWFKESSSVDIVDLHHAPGFPAIQRAAGSERKISTHEVPLEYSIGGLSMVLPRTLIISSPEQGRNSLPCTLGADAIAVMAPVSLDFGRMQIALR